MNALVLRRLAPIPPALIALKRSARGQGVAVDAGPLDPHRLYLQCGGKSAHGVWAAVLDPQQWLRHTLAALPGLIAERAWNEAALALFRALPRPFEPLLAELDYGPLDPPRLVSGNTLSTDCLPCLAAPWGELWLTQWPCASLPRVPAAWLARVPFGLYLALGQAGLTLKDWQTLQCSDVLRITQRTDRLYLADRLLGSFTLTPEGFTMTLIPGGAAPHDQIPGDLPVTLTFVLHEFTLTLAQLAALTESDIHALPANASGNVTLLANGEPFGRGELVQLDNGLGVEIQVLGDE